MEEYIGGCSACGMSSVAQSSGRSMFSRTWVQILAVAVLFLTQVEAWHLSPKPITTSSLSDISGEAVKFLGDSKYVDHFRILSETPDHVVLGARNAMYNVSLSTMTVIKRLDWAAVTPCVGHSSNDEECQNYIRVATWRTPDELFVCGTNGLDSFGWEPGCRTFKAEPSSYNEIGKERSGIGIAPYWKEDKSALVVDNGRVFSGVHTNKPPSRSAVISGLNLDGSRLTTEGGSAALYDAEFARTFTYGDKVYVFFRETALETRSCMTRTRYSRVAQICRNDAGAVERPNIWASFFKARVTCSVPGTKIPFYFDRLVDMSELGQGSDSNLVYGVFTTHDNSITGSAICAFSMREIEQVFRGNLAKKTNFGWSSVSAPSEFKGRHPTECTNSSVSLDTLNTLDTHRLMFNPVRPEGGKPVFLQSGTEERLTHVVVDWRASAGDGQAYHVIFVGTDQGRVYKLLRRANDSAAAGTLLETIQVLQEGSPVAGLRLAPGGKLVVVGNDEVVSINRARCGSRTNCGECVALQDPYCSWNLASSRCVDNNRGLQDVISGQDPSCPASPVSVSETQAPTTTTTSTTSTSTTERTTTIPTSTPPSTTAPAPEVTCPPQKPCSCPVVAKTTVTAASTASSTTSDDPQVVNAGVGASAQQGTGSDGISGATLGGALAVSIILSLVVGFIVGFVVSRLRSGLGPGMKCMNRRDKTHTAESTENGDLKTAYKEPKMELKEGSSLSNRRQAPSLTIPTLASGHGSNDIAVMPTPTKHFKELNLVKNEFDGSLKMPNFGGPSSPGMSTLERTKKSAKVYV